MRSNSMGVWWQHLDESFGAHSLECDISLTTAYVIIAYFVIKVQLL